ncbi:MAG TPA: glutamate racemase [Candidatus Hydrogenedens sp.]|nr:glutamate racemase [Candidatus Hydrogenedens sp.]HOK08205.1 glutamate racemase [Candidatus Hydrogenedens sp.]HOL20124.1 glutamate racemase [Candidatus Hydrogenedens sp.]HPP58674.1 glutamate racemase [Candidatus Hydrogenedens sp.]
MARLPIGVFDSGIGGLTVLAKLKKYLPNETFFYLGDTARVPYGTRSPETVIRYARSCSHFLINRGIKILVIACNTASSQALPMLEKEADIPILGVVEPGALSAVKTTKNKQVAVIGTEGTIASQSYVKHIKKIDPSINVISKACPLFVPLVEEGWTKGNIPFLVAKQYLQPIIDKGIDTLLLGCTHYPLLIPIIKKVIENKKIKIIDSAEETAKAVFEILQNHNMLNKNIHKKTNTILNFFVTDRPEKFKTIGSKFLREKIEHVEWIDIPILS